MANGEDFEWAIYKSTSFQVLHIMVEKCALIQTLKIY